MLPSRKQKRRSATEVNESDYATDQELLPSRESLYADHTADKTKPELIL